jgi:hypothetical protein
MTDRPESNDELPTICMWDGIGDIANRLPMIEQVRELTFAKSHRDDMLYFVPAALELGCTEDEAEEIDMLLTQRIMTARGAI